MSSAAPETKDVEQDAAGKWNFSDERDVDREAQEIDPAVEKRVVRK